MISKLKLIQEEIDEAEERMAELSKKRSELLKMYTSSYYDMVRTKTFERSKDTDPGMKAFSHGH